MSKKKSSTSVSASFSENKSGLLQIAFYALVTSLYLVAAYMDHIIFTEKRFEKAGLNLHSSFGGRAKFLTLIDLYIQVVYFVLCLLNALIEFLFDRNKKNPKPRLLRKVTNFVYTSVGFPAAVLVCTVFWGLFYLDRDLIYSKKIEDVIPTFQNHLIHTLPIFSAILDSYVTKHSYDKSFIKGVIPTLIFSASYTIWVLIIAHYGGFWVYPVLKVLPTLYRVLFIVALFLLTSFLYKCGELLNNSIWTNTNRKVITSKSD